MRCLLLALLPVRVFGILSGGHQLELDSSARGELDQSSSGPEVPAHANLSKLDLGTPVCITQLGDPQRRCQLISQKLCDSTSTRVTRADWRLGKCFAPQKTCAVVGSSQHLLNVTLGKMIDSHDVVIRVNGAPAGSTGRDPAQNGFGPHVGTRTNVRFLNPYAAFPDVTPAEQECIFVHEPAIPLQCGGRRCSKHPATCNSSAYARLCRAGSVSCAGRPYQVPHFDRKHHHVFMDNFHAGVADEIVPNWTGGFLAIVYALGVCDRVTVVGFGPSCNGEVGARYYSNPVAIAPYHHYEDELALLLKASEHGPGAVIPARARRWLVARQVSVQLPSCVVQSDAARLSQVFEDLGAKATVNLVSEVNAGPS